MQSWENRKFEQSWQEAFADAEQTPSGGVWNGIDLSLSRNESSSMKKRVVFYQRIAAAAIFFGLCLSAGGGLYWMKVREQNLAVRSKMQNAESLVNKNMSDEKSDANLKLNKDEKILEEKYESSASSRFDSEIKNQNVAANNSFNSDSSQVSEMHRRDLPAQNKSNRNYFSEKVAPSISSNELPALVIHLPEMKTTELVAAKKWKTANPVDGEKKKIKENWWASINGSGGAFNQQASSNTYAASAYKTNLLSAISAAPVSNQATAGTSFSFGMTMGKRISERWMLMSGVSYLNQSIGYNSNVIVVDASNQARAFLADLASQSTNIASANPYLITSASEFISVPVQAGYLLLNRKAGIQLNTGISADLFYRNTIKDESGRIGSYSQGNGENSPYRTLNWTGLLGSEFSYKFTNHYRVSLLPGLRYSLNSVLKDYTGSSNPVVWDVGFRLKYIF